MFDAPEPKVPEKARRRIFSPEYKLRILQPADGCTSPAASRGFCVERVCIHRISPRGAATGQRILQGLQPVKRGPKPSETNPLLPELEKLRKENELLEKRLKRAEIIIEVQKKVSQMQGTEPFEGSLDS